MRKGFVILGAVVLSIAPFYPRVCVSAENEQDASYKEISSFRDYAWGSSLDKIKEGEITPDMLEPTHYEIGSFEDTDMTSLLIRSSNVGGYDASAMYIFSDDALVSGVYTLDLVGDDEVNDIIGKYSSIYGDPAVEKEVSSEISFFIWIDNNGDKIVIATDTNESADSDAIIYFQNESPVWDFYSEGLSGSEMDIEKELDKVGNTDGI